MQNFDLLAGAAANKRSSPPLPKRAKRMIEPPRAAPRALLIAALALALPLSAVAMAGARDGSVRLMGYVPVASALAIQQVTAAAGNSDGDGVIALDLTETSNNPDGYSIILGGNADAAYSATFAGQPVQFIDGQAHLSMGNGAVKSHKNRLELAASDLSAPNPSPASQTELTLTLRSN